MSCCGNKRKQAAGAGRPTLASPAGELMRRTTDRLRTKAKPVTPPVTPR